MNYWTERFGMIDVSSYDQLRRHFDDPNRKPFRGTDDKPFGHRKYGNRRMRMLDDESIELEYMGEPLVRWHPDNTVSVKAFASRRQGAFNPAALPDGVTVGIGTRTGPLIYLFQGESRSWWIKTPKPKEQQKGEWDTYTYERNPNISVLLGNDWVHLRNTANGWEPIVEDALEDFTWYEPDKSRTRKISAEYNIPAFVNAMQAMIKLGADVKEAPPRWRSGGLNYSAEERLDQLLQNLKDQNFLPVMHAVGRSTSSTYNEAKGCWEYETKSVASTDMKRLRDRLYVMTGVCETKRAKIVNFKQWAQIERRRKDFGIP